MSVITADHGLSVALMQPEIAPNTGNIGRLCVATGAALHLVRPMGFILGDKQLKRSGMDYWERLKLTVHDDDGAFVAAMKDRRLWLFSSKATLAHWDAKYQPGDVLVFGNESRGLTDSFRARFSERLVRIPQVADERCLNVSTAVGIAMYEAIRQVNAANNRQSS